MKPLHSLTLRRQGRECHQFTFWTDGVGRFDGQIGPILGAWHAHIPGDLGEMFDDLVKRLPRSVPQSRECYWTLAVERSSGARRVIPVAPTDRNSAGWMIALLLEGMRSTTAWAPLDTRGGRDWGAWASATTMRMCQASVMATALARPEGFVVLSGSVASTATAASVDKSYRVLRGRLIEEGALRLDRHDRYVITQHLGFDSPSAAASVLAGSNTNGRSAWRDSHGVPWSDLDRGDG